MRLSDFDYDLPRELIAQYPAETRESSRMLVLDRATGGIRHERFSDLEKYVGPRDVIVLNDTRVIKARLFGNRATGGRIELFFLGTAEKGRFKALIRPSKKVREGEEIYFGDFGLKAKLIAKKPGGSILEFSPATVDIEKLLAEAGSVPLPPYIKRDQEPVDEERYQTVYAKVPGATAAPTAGLHFTDEVLSAIESKGARIARVTLHVSYGTFAPVKSEDVAGHRMHSEAFNLTGDTAAVINSVKAGGGRVVAVGTTSCRVLETCAVSQVDSRRSTLLRQGFGGQAVDRVEGEDGNTDLFIYPGYKFKIVDALLTNFHLPRSTLLMLVSAFAGRESILKAYKEAVERKYRFYSYGDCMLII